MCRNIWKRHVQPSRDDNLRSIPVLPRAHERSIVDRALDDLVRTRLAADDADVILHRRLPQAQVLADEDAYAYAGDVEPVQERVGRFHQLELDGVPPYLDLGVGERRAPPARAVALPEEGAVPYRRAQLERAPGHLDEHGGVALVDVLQDFGESDLPRFLSVPLALGRGLLVQRQYFEEGGGVQLLDLLH